MGGAFGGWCIVCEGPITCDDFTCPPVYGVWEPCGSWDNSSPQSCDYWEKRTILCGTCPGQAVIRSKAYQHTNYLAFTCYNGTYCL
jgi:hypothetical protein